MAGLRGASFRLGLGDEKCESPAVDAREPQRADKALFGSCSRLEGKCPLESCDVGRNGACAVGGREASLQSSSWVWEHRAETWAHTREFTAGEASVHKDRSQNPIPRLGEFTPKELELTE